MCNAPRACLKGQTRACACGQRGCRMGTLQQIHGPPPYGLRCSMRCSLHLFHLYAARLQRSMPRAHMQWARVQEQC